MKAWHVYYNPETDRIALFEQGPFCNALFTGFSVYEMFYFKDDWIEIGAYL